VTKGGLRLQEMPIRSRLLLGNLPRVFASDWVIARGDKVLGSRRLRRSERLRWCASDFWNLRWSALRPRGQLSEAVGVQHR
jgi:hypothetical protein